MRAEPSSSEGFGGISPERMTSSRSMPLWTIASSMRDRSSSRLLKPTDELFLSRRAIFGRRRSQSSKTTRFSACAKEMARFSAVMLLPSP